MGLLENILVLPVLSKEKNQDNATYITERILTAHKFVPIHLVVLILYEYKIGVRLKKIVQNCEFTY